MRLILAAVVLIAATPAWAQSTVVDFSRDDPEMNGAIRQARATLPGFWEAFADPAANESDHSLKLGIEDTDGNSEHLWCGDIVGNAEAASCVITNRPVYVSNVTLGERIDVDFGIVSDWMFYRDDLIVGGETMKVMLGRMEKKEAAALGIEFAE